MSPSIDSREVTGSGQDDVRGDDNTISPSSRDQGSRWRSFVIVVTIVVVVVAVIEVVMRQRQQMTTRTSATIQAQWHDTSALRMDAQAGLHGGQWRKQAADNGANRGCNNQPLVRAAKASSGWQ